MRILYLIMLYNGDINGGHTYKMATVQIIRDIVGYENLDIQVVTSAAGSKYAKVTLAYRYTIPLLNMLLEHQITGYAK